MLHWCFGTKENLNLRSKDLSQRYLAAINPILIYVELLNDNYHHICIIIIVLHDNLYELTNNGSN